MAKGNITGLSIDLGMDTRKVTEAAKAVKSDLSLMNSEMKKNMSAFDRSEKSVEKFSTRLGGLEKKLGIQERAVSSARSEYELMVKQYGEGSEQAKKAERNLNNQEASYNNLERATGSARKELEAYKKEQEIANSKWTVFGEKLDLYGDKMVKFGSGMKDVGKKMTLGITTPIVGFGLAATKIGADFDDSMAKVSAVSGATGDDLETLRDKAKEMGKNTKFSASEAAEGMNYMALAGWSTEEMLGGLDGVMNLAAASGEELGAVSDIVTDSLSAFGLEAKDSGKLADVLAQTSSKANTDVTGLGNAFKYVAPVAGSLGFTVEDTAKAIGLMSDNGIKGEKAGTALRTMMTNLAKPTKAMQEEMDNLGISLTDTDGNMKTFDEIMGDLRGSFSGLTEQQQASAAATIFGKESMSGALAIINTSEESFDSLGNAINNSEGAAQTMAEVMEGTLGGTFRKIKSGLEGLAISIYETMLPTLEKVTGKFLNLVEWLNNLSPKVKTLGVVFAAAAAAIGPLLIAGGSLIMFFGGVLKTLAPVSAAIAKAGGLLSWLRLGLVAITGPVGLTIAGIAALGAGFVIAYNKSETFRNFIDGLKGKFVGAWQKAIEFKDKVITAISGIKSFFTGDTEGGIKLLQSIGLSDETIEKVWVSVGKIRKSFFEMKFKINEALAGVKTFFISMFTDIKDWWDTDGTLIFSAIKTTVSTALTFVVDLFNRFKPIVLGIWNAIFPVMHFIIKMVWEKIKLVVGIGMDVIQGIISGVSALIEGDWSRFGQILKDTALSIWNRIKEYFTNMKNNALTIFGDLFRGAKQWFSDMWTNITNKVRDIKNNVVNRFNDLKNGAIGKVRETYNSIKQWFQDLWSNVTNKVTDIKNGVVRRFTNMKDGAIEGVQKLYNGASGIFDDVKDYAKDTFQNMVDGAKALPGNIGDAIKGAASKAVDGVKSLGNKMGEKLGSVVNGVTGGLNKMLGAIGLGKGDLIPDIDIPTFSTGTRNGRLSSDTLGVVNDRGPGNGRGGATQELIERNGSIFMPKGKDAIVPLKKGDRIYSGAETQSLMSSGLLPNFSQGTGSEGGSGGKKKGLLGTLTDVVKNVWGYIQDPGKAFSALMDSVTANFDGMDGFAGKMLSGGWNMLTNGIKGFISKIFKDNEGALGSGQGGKWMGYPMTTPYSPNSPVPGYPTGFNGGRHYGIDYGAPRGTPITATMSGKLSSFWNEGGGKIAKLVTGQLRQFFMHMQTVKPNGNVKKGDVIGKTGNSGRWTTGPHVHWQAQQGTDALNTSTIDPRKVLSNHRKGGILQREGMFWGAEGNKEEVVIPLHRPSEAMKLMNYVASKMGGGSKQTSSVPNVPRGNDHDLSVLEDKLDKMIQLMQLLLEKDQDIKLNGRSVKEEMDQYDYDDEMIQRLLKGRKKGVPAT